MDLSTVKTRVRSLTDDPDATYQTDEFLIPLINQKYEELYNRLLVTSGSEFERKAAELPGVAAQTADLSAFQLPAQPLDLLVQPLTLEFKQAGTQVSNYRTADLVGRVSDVSSPGQMITDWEWRAGVIYFTPAILAMDIRIRGDFLFAVLSTDGDPISPTKNFGHMLAYGVASLVGSVRGNAGWEKSYMALQDSAFDDIAGYLARKDQAKVRRLASTRRRSNRYAFIQGR
jgi:hypothetical protein